MRRKAVPVALERSVRERANAKCEYCRSPANAASAPFSTEHILPIALEGTDDADNLAFACLFCNLSKGARIASLDPATNLEVALFNPRLQTWSKHFRWSRDTLNIIALTPTGRATLDALPLTATNCAICGRCSNWPTNIRRTNRHCHKSNLYPLALILYPFPVPEIQLYNTLSRSKEPLAPRTPGEISLYVCGVTPYDKLHIGHARAFLTYDVLRRFLESKGLRVRHIQNVTDIDDKIINRAREVGRDPLANSPAQFHEDSLVELAQLDILPANEYPRVTTHIAPILAMVETLEQKGYAYANEGDVYFDVSRKDDDYGKLIRPTRRRTQRGRAH